jgi:transposase
LENNKKEVPESISEDLFENLPNEAQDFIKKIDTENNKLKAQVEKLLKQQKDLEEEVKKLNGMLRLNSSNSSKPPSSDGLKKNSIPGTQRVKTGKKQGAQIGHQGSRLVPVETPNHIVNLIVKKCKSCKLDLSNTKINKMKITQVFDIPPIKLEVTQYQAECKDCPDCGVKNEALFPKGIYDIPAQYGINMKANALFLMTKHLIPSRRVSEIIEGFTGHAVSIGSIMNWQKKAFIRLDPFERVLEEKIINSEVVHFDETGMQVDKKLNWLHSASTEEFTIFRMHPKRGKKAMSFFNLLPRFEGIAVHDAWSSYFVYKDAKHALCGSHLLRELKFLKEEAKEDWAGKMSELLSKTHGLVEQAKRDIKGNLTDLEINSIIKDYQLILNEGFKLHEKDEVREEIKRGRKPQSKGKNLLNRMKIYEEEVLRFMKDFRVPFTNNLAEQDIRMNKVKQKISGCFRNFEASEYYCRIRSYLSTCRKHGKDSLESLKEVFTIHPEKLSDFLM